MSRGSTGALNLHRCSLLSLSGEEGCRLLPGPMESELRPTTAQSSSKSRHNLALPSSRRSDLDPGPRREKGVSSRGPGRLSQPVLDEDKFTSKSNHLMGDDTHRSVLFRTHVRLQYKTKGGQGPRWGLDSPTGRQLGADASTVWSWGAGCQLHPRDTARRPRPGRPSAEAHPPLSGSSGSGSRSCTSGSWTYS